MIFWVPIVGFFGIAVGYGFLPDAQQVLWESAANQWHAVMLAWLAFLCVGYENTCRKAAAVVLLLWTLIIASTDGFISWYPSWGMIPEALGMAALLLRVMWKIHAIQSHQKTR